MKTGKRKLRHIKNEGFTLIEVILILVILGIMGAMIIAIVGPSLTGGPLAVLQVGNQYRVIQEMEAINNEYRQHIVNNDLNLNAFQADVEARATARIQVVTALNAINIPGYGDTTQPVLSVTLRDTENGQTVQAFFTQ